MTKFKVGDTVFIFGISQAYGLYLGQEIFFPSNKLKSNIQCLFQCIIKSITIDNKYEVTFEKRCIVGFQRPLEEDQLFSKEQVKKHFESIMKSYQSDINLYNDLIQ